MRSLSLKLTLAFLFVSIVGIVLAGLFVRQRTQREFDKFVLDRYQVDLIDDLANFYEQNGSWREFSAILIRAPGRFGRGGRAFPAPITLSDEQGKVVFGGTVHKNGDVLSKREIDNAVPVQVNNDTVGLVLFTDSSSEIVALPETPESRFLESVNQAVLSGALSALLIALLIGIFLARTISRPVREVTEATRVVASGELGVQVPVRTKDELGELADSFNKMSIDLDLANKQRRQMTADIAHDLRTPLSVILGYMESLATEKLEATPETLEIMYAKGLHVQHLIDDLRILALADAGELTLKVRPADPEALLEHTALAHMIQAREKSIEIRVEAADDLPEIEIDPDRMAQVLGNLVSNSLRYTPAGGEIILSAEAADRSVFLRVADNGSGIHPDDTAHIFDRFYRSDKARRQEGSQVESGLGLAIAKSIVSAHAGDIEVSSTVGEGTTFTISLPQTAG